MKKIIKSQFKSFWKSFRFKLSASDNPLFIGFYKYFYQPKKGSLSDFLSQYSNSKKGDFFVVQIGANDGITHDPIHKFIKRDRWSGVLMEPQPTVYRESLSKIYQNHEGLHPLCAAIGEEDGSQKLYKIGFSEMRWATGLASFSLEKVQEHYKEGIVQKNCKKYGLNMPMDPSQQISFENVKVISPETLMESYSISKIDLLQIDAEGFDLEVIRIFDIEKTQPQAIIFENENLNKEDLQNCYELLEKNGYKTQKFGKDTLALKTPLGEFESFFKE
ncbi:FkbM family methyltransferase [Echinicola jeungdonensis]|uniref:FkbM family methyltransferase n=1 Tax=Echinicola jeungdonensis TaxID=709343 RepID=A0ABV5J8W4_9BACT|nr:FkbM family methyltransferase [Echinicola jeungdonensis]MDN3670801.1 FkbM family methyltransferase [Echinicola jeungdonensis]